ncbi:DUF4280 domain-containing protein [Apibacter adventoris]|uniref:DUF4280 domain-containing protein n=1 Tax=Apibacter adventoris TaxID=1679466 RepID=A0A2S8ACD4_9FLAO|nr:DUF4280 domain-containing protein [Apibacter adventoris]PQL92355.1 DUF4280 domain-containing protein [Apibacter adventoris]
MSEKHVVVQGATCKCQFGNCPDSLVVKTHQKEYANDAEGSDKLIVTTKELGSSTLKNNSFGSCSKLGSPPPPCKVAITQWTDFYEPVTLSNKGKVILENSKATCAIAGTPCISITYHGQVAEPSAQNFKNVNREIQSQINPMVDINEMTEEELIHEGGEDSSI